MDEISTVFYDDIKNIITSAQTAAVRSVDRHRVIMYWQLGERIFTEEQRGENRATYGEYLLRNISKRLEEEFGSGFSYRQLAYCRKFYRLYPIVNAVRSQLNWYQYRLLTRIDDDYKREYYELEATNNAWTGRELERQINASLYERLLLSNDKESVLAIARKERTPESPTEIIKDPISPTALPRGNRNQNPQNNAPRPRPTTNVCKLLRPLRKTPRRKPNRRHPTMRRKKRRPRKNNSPRKQHNHTNQPIPTIPPLRRNPAKRNQRSLTNDRIIKKAAHPSRLYNFPHLLT